MPPSHEIPSTTTGANLTTSTYANPVSVAAAITVSGPLYGIRGRDIAWQLSNHGSVTGIQGGGHSAL